MVPLHPGIVLPYLFSRKMFGTHRFSGWFGEGKNAFSLLGFDPRFVGCRALNLDTIRPRHSCSCWTWLWKRVQSVMLFALKSLLLQRIGFQPYCYRNFTVEKTCSSPVKVKPAVSTVWGYNSSAYTTGGCLSQGWPWLLIEIFRASWFEICPCRSSWAYMATACLFCKGLCCVNDL